MYAAERPSKRPVLIVLLLASWLLIACGDQISNANWPGLSASGDTVYVAYGSGVLAYDVASGEQAWSFSPAPGRLLFYAAPSVQDGRVIVGDFGASRGFFNPGVAANVYGLRETSGSTPDELWTSSGVANDRIVAPPLQVGDMAYVGTADNQLLALDATSGEVMWRVPTEHSIWAQPAYKDGVVYVGSLDKNVYALDAETGAVRWRTLLSGAIAGRPMVNGDLMYVTSFDRKLHALFIDTGEEAWSVDAGDWIWGAATLDDGVVYFADAAGVVYAVDSETGAERWTQQVSGVVQTSPTVANGRLFITSDLDAADDESPGMITVLSTADGVQLWQQQTTVPVFATPVVVADVLVVAVQTETDLLIGYDVESGTQQWTVSVPEQS